VLFSRMIIEANRGPRRATEAATSTSKPVAPREQPLSYHTPASRKRYRSPQNGGSWEPFAARASPALTTAREILPSVLFAPKDNRVERLDGLGLSVRL